MPDLVQSLHGRDLGHLRIVAELWGVGLDAPDAHTGLEQLANILLNREMLDEVIESLPENARLAIKELLQKEGRMSWAGFIRRYGAVREMGPARRDREQPYLNVNASSSETLWYRALIGRAFFDGPAGPEEFAYIPDDLLEILPPLDLREAPSLGRLASPLERAFPMLATDAILDDACTLLAALRVGLADEEYLALLRCGLSTPYRLTPDSLKALLSAAGILDENLIPLPEPTRLFLEAGRGDALSGLVAAWLRSPVFNELWFLPGVITEGVWQNDPLLARQAVIDFLSTVPGNQGALGEERERPYWSLPAFVASIRQLYPDFQRPAGDYDSWYLCDRASGESLRGFEHWDEVDGASVRFIIAGPMHWLGIVDLAEPASPESEERSPVTAFRFSAWAADLLDQAVPPRLPTEDKPLTVRSDGKLRVPIGAPRSARYQVARFCEWGEFSDEVYHYRLTPASLERAYKQGLRVEHLLALFGRYARALPPNLAQALRRWETQGNEVRLQPALILRVKDPAILQALRSSRAARFLGEPLGPAAVIVKPGAQEKVLSFLAEMGYLGVWIDDESK